MTTTVELNCEVTDLLWPWDRSTPVVMLHGFSRNASVWLRWLPFLSQHHRVYRLELPGMGHSPQPPADFRWSETSIRESILRVLDRFDLARVHWVGESSGGMIGALLAAACPDRVASLVLVETPLRRIASLRASHSVGHSSNVAAIEALGVEEWCRQTVGLRLDTDRAHPELVEWYVQQLAKTPVPISVAMKNFADTLDMEPALPLLAAPTLLLYGDKSRVLTEEQVRTIERDVRDLEVRVFAGYGHGLHVLEPEACALAAVDFWERHANGVRGLPVAER